MLLLVSLVGAEPLMGGLDLAKAGQVVIKPGVEMFPVNGYGGSLNPELFAGVGFGPGFDVRLGGAMTLPVYAFDDGGIVEPYMSPELAFIDVVLRWTAPPQSPIFPEDQFAIGLRVDNRSFSARYFGADEFGFGPELAWSHHAGPAWIFFRPNFLTQPYWWPDAFGLLGLAAAISLPLGAVEPFFDFEPRVWMSMGHAGNSGLVFMPAPTLAARVGTHVHFAVHQSLVVACTWSPESHFHPEENLAAFLGYRLSLGG